MTWVTWRQHRLEGAWSATVTAALAVTIVFVTMQIAGAGCSGPGEAVCLRDDLAGRFASSLIQFNLYQYGLVVLPALAGAFIGAPLVAREFEAGTYRLAWTQGVTRTRWIVTKLLLVGLPLLAAAALVGSLEILLINAQGPQANRWAFFDQQAPMTIAATLFAFALGVAVGSGLRQPIPAMAVTLLVFVVSRILIAEIARPHFIAPLAMRTQNPAAANSPLSPTAWRLDDPQWVDAAGNDLPQRAIAATGGNTDVIRAHGYYLVQHYQPGDRFWTFQWIEVSILCVLALALLALAVYWVRRRAV